MWFKGGLNPSKRKRVVGMVKGEAREVRGEGRLGWEAGGRWSLRPLLARKTRKRQPRETQTVLARKRCNRDPVHVGERFLPEEDEPASSRLALGFQPLVAGMR